MADKFNQIVSEKLDSNNFPTWRFQMTNFLQGKGYWDYIEGENDEASRCPEVNATPEEKKALKDWKQGKSKVMYWLSMSVSDSMMGYLESAPSLAIAWKSLEKLNEDHTRVRKLQLKTELNTVIRTTEGIWLFQRQYALDMLSKYGMLDCKPISMPLDVNTKLSAHDDDVLKDLNMYRIVGSFIYLTITRPDLSYAVGLQSQFMQLPRKPHLDAMRRALRYVRATLDHALFYAADVPVELHGYTDADWVGSATDRRSTSGFMFTLGSAAITWSSKKQPTVALSSTEAEYRGAAVAACEISWLRKLLMDLRLQVDREVVIYCDNLSSIQLAENPVFHARTKHIEVHYHFVRDQVLASDIDLVYVSTEEQVADIFTKALGAEKLRRFWLMLGVLQLALSSRGSVEMSSSP
ncbi:hypothetical protein L7F22_058546 [Adiantum nelumboides]|nr:hypothetical protein [Adiantum nelumboides]